MKKLSYIIPCYGSEQTIEIVSSEIVTLMDLHPEFDYEIILVNDHSPDNVWEVICRLSEKNPRIHGIAFSQNFGQHAALMAGYQTSTGDYIVTLDDDGQTPVNQTFLLLDGLINGSYDVVYGKYADRKDNNFRKLGTRMNNFMLEYLLGKPKDIQMTSYFIARRFIIQKICEYTHGFPYIWGLVLRTTKNIGNVIISHNNRMDGESGYTLRKLLSLWMNGFTAFSVKPLRITATIGTTFSLIGLVLLIYTIVDRLSRPDMVPGYTALMSILLIIGGLILISLGLIGEYVGRIYMCINNTPQFVISETTAKREEHSS